ncbi:MAG: aa3-type cytochrome oxidase subunit II [Nocardioidaceae bacterium]
MSPQLTPRVRRVALLTLLPMALLALGACSNQQDIEIKRLAEPVGATDRAPAMHALWMWGWLAAILVGILVWGLIAYASVRYHRRSDDEVPVQTRYNLPIEILYTIAPIIMVVVFFYHTVKTQDEVLKPIAHPQHQIDVVGQQWSWTFNYVKDKDLDGQTTVFDAGTTAYEPTLVLPVNETVTVHLSSPDVIHSFWVPAFLFKMDVVPGRHNHFSFTPTRKGDYVGRCAELCGVYHSRMLFKVRIVTHDQYAAYLQSLEAKGDTGLQLGGSMARTEAGLETGQNGAGQ